MRPIAISGKMCTGKTTLLNILQSREPKMKRVSLADPVKEVAHRYFRMNENEKDRLLLQQIGQQFRTIRPSVWIDLLAEKAQELIAEGYIPVCDDVRFPNELAHMADKGWVAVRLTLNDLNRQARVKRTYGGEWENHWSNRNEESETSLDNCETDEWFDFIVENDTIETLEELAHEIIDFCDQ